MKAEIMVMEERQIMTLIIVPAKGSDSCSPAGSFLRNNAGAIVSRVVLFYSK